MTDLQNTAQDNGPEHGTHQIAEPDDDEEGDKLWCHGPAEEDDDGDEKPPPKESDKGEGAPRRSL
ncbi:MAG TPA: hypothetical protein VNE38_11745 [Ktedonobacteraceae bacterium]|nr:hypothetical protein [Ktedonobacteraceae bacterium]